MLALTRPPPSTFQQQLADSAEIAPHVQDIAIALMVADLRDRFAPEQCPTWRDLGVIQQDRYLRAATVALRSLSPGVRDIATWQAGRCARRLMAWLNRELSHADTRVVQRPAVYRRYADAVVTAYTRHLAGETGRSYCDFCENEAPGHHDTCRESDHSDHAEDFRRIGYHVEPGA